MSDFSFARVPGISLRLVLLYHGVAADLNHVPVQ